MSALSERRYTRRPSNVSNHLATPHLKLLASSTYHSSQRAYMTHVSLRRIIQELIRCILTLHHAPEADPSSWYLGQYKLAVAYVTVGFPFLSDDCNMKDRMHEVLVTSSTDNADSIRLAQGDAVETPHKLIHEAFSQAAARNATTVAAEHDGDQITYGELDLASTNLSRRLLELGLCPRDRVVLLVQRSIPMIVAILAVLKSGCQYVPLDGGVVSDDALAHVLSETDPPFVLCLARYSQRAQQFAMPETRILSLEDPEPALTDFDTEIGREILVAPNDGAYIIYTSGKSCVQVGR